MQDKHNSVSRDYLARVTDLDFPKYRAAEIAKQWGKDYWDGDRRVGYGGYSFIPELWAPLANKLVETYSLTEHSRVLDVGCGKGFLLACLKSLIPGLRVIGIDPSPYAIEEAPPEVGGLIVRGQAESLPFDDTEFDLVLSINVVHNLQAPELELALRELQRVAKRAYLVVESYDSEFEKQNLLYWQLTCEAFNTPREWEWWFQRTGFLGDYEFIFFR